MNSSDSVNKEGSSYRTQWGYDRVTSREDNFSRGFMTDLNGL